MIQYILSVIIGFILLIKGADLFVDGMASTSLNLKIPKIIISLTIIAFGTSAPELFISFQGLLSGNDDIVLANVIGSTIVNTMLVIGLSAIIKPIKIKNETIKKQLPLHLITITIFSILLLDNTFNNDINTISRSDGIILFSLFLYFLYYIYKFSKQNTNKQSKENINPKWDLKKSIIYSIIGLIFIMYGSELAVNNCANIANELNISQKLITMIILVIGTSSPEIILAITSARKGEFDIILGNIVGTNIFNIGFVLGFPIILLGNVTSTNFTIIDMFFMVLSAIILYIFAKDDKTINKLEGLIMLTIFLIYYAYLFIT